MDPHRAVVYAHRGSIVSRVITLVYWIPFTTVLFFAKLYRANLNFPFAHRFYPSFYFVTFL